MRGRLPFSVIAAAVLAALAGCGRGFFQFEERAPWRHDAEVECLNSGALKEGTGVVRISPIEGPGMCGADFPLKVSALGESSALGFADDPRPPGSIPNARPAQPPWPVTPRYAPGPAAYPPAPAPVSAEPLDVPPAASAPIYDSAPPDYSPAPARQNNAPPQGYGAPAGEPLSLSPPNLAAPPQSYAPPPSYPPDRAAYPPYQAPQSYPSNRPASAPPPLGPARDPRFAGSTPSVEVKPAATLACPIVSVLDRWITESVQPAAMRWFGQPVVEIHQISAYSCRTMNGQPGANISEHAFGNALDIAAFTLADGRKIVVRTAWKGKPEEQGFLHDVQGSACQDFTTVLAPGANVFHYDHIHVDLMRRASRRLICEPTAISGEVAAARASRQYAHRDPGVTGSIGRQKRAAAAAEQVQSAAGEGEDAFDN